MLSGMFQVPLWVKAEAAGEFFRIHGFWALILEGFHTGAFFGSPQLLRSSYQLGCSDTRNSLTRQVERSLMLSHVKNISWATHFNISHRPVAHLVSQLFLWQVPCR